MYYGNKILKWWSNLRWFMSLVMMRLRSQEILKGEASFQRLFYPGFLGRMAAIAPDKTSIREIVTILALFHGDYSSSATHSRKLVFRYNNLGG